MTDPAALSDAVALMAEATSGFVQDPYATEALRALIAAGWTLTPPERTAEGLAALSDDELEEAATEAILAAAAAGSGDDRWTALERIRAECDVRAGGWPLYARAWNRVTASAILDRADT